MEKENFLPKNSQSDLLSGSQEHERPRPDVLYGTHNVRVYAALTALLFADADTIQPVLEYLSLNRVMLGNGCFCISVSRMINSEASMEYANVLEFSGEFATMVEEKLLQKAIFYMIPIKGTIVCILAVPHRTEDQDHLNEIRSLLISACEEAGTQIKTKYQASVLTAISPMFSGAENIPTSYQRSNDLLEFQQFFGEISGVFIPDARGCAPVWRIQRASELEKQCRMQCNLIASRKMNTAFLQMKETLSEIRKSVPGSLEQFKAECFQFVRLLIVEMLENKIITEEQIQNLDIFGVIKACCSEAELLKLLKKLLQNITEPYYQQLQQASYISASNMRTYLETNCTDVNLTITRAAEAFQMSQAAFSGYYKRRLGVTPLEDLNRFRIKYACSLLETSNRSAEEIMHASGFDSISTMRRLFKKYCGMTPVQYRNNYRISNSDMPESNEKG